MLKSVTCAIAIAISLPAVAHASDPDVQREIVRFDDLNLASPAGAQRLERRIAAAARRVCNYNDSRGSAYIVPQNVTQCMSAALASARQQVAVKTGALTRKG